jgi:hypothetical protein
MSEFPDADAQQRERKKADAANPLPPHPPEFAEGCICRWYADRDRGEWIRDYPNSQCQVHFKRCQTCHGQGTVAKDLNTALIVERNNQREKV